MCVRLGACACVRVGARVRRRVRVCARVGVPFVQHLGGCGIYASLLQKCTSLSIVAILSRFFVVY